MVTDVEWRNPGTVYFQKENDHWRPYWQGMPRWMVPEMLVRIADALAKHQDGFLEKGFSKMAALTMKEIASSVGCAESSVSRIIYGVEAETPWGRLPLKCFFSQKVPSTHGFTSQTSIIEKVVKLIGTEDKQKPFSDEDIVKIIRQEGIDIARRTITKYRQKIRIAARSERKKDENNFQKTFPDSETKSSISIATPDSRLHITPRKTIYESKSSNIISYPGKDYLVISKPKGQETANPISAEVCIERGKRYEDDGKYDLAIEEYEEAIAFNPNEGRAYLGAGINFERIGKREKAVFYYKIAVKLGNKEALEFLRSMGIE
jgi:hypothetical protein